MQNRAVHQAKIDGVQRNARIRKVTDDAVKKPGCPKLESSFSVALRANPINYVISIHPLRHEIEDDFRGVLQIGVDDGHAIAGGVLQAGGNRDLMPEVSRKADYADS